MVTRQALTSASGQQSFLNGIMTPELFADVRDDAKRFVRMYPYIREPMMEILNHFDGTSELEVLKHLYETN